MIELKKENERLRAAITKLGAIQNNNNNHGTG